MTMSYYIGSFNIRDFNFANRSSDNERIQRDFDKIAEIIIKEKYDVVGIQEVNAEIAVKHLTNVLNRHKTIFCEWAYRYGAPIARNTKDPEGYAFIWNVKRLRLLDMGNKQNPTYYVAAGASQLLRPPYYARFTARGMIGGSNFELRLVNVHIRDAIHEADRIKEFDVLVKQVMPRCCDQRGLSVLNECMPVYTILLGDYNLPLNKGERAIFKINRITMTNYTGRNRFYVTEQEEKTSLRKVGYQQSIDECYANNYDHFTYEFALSQKLKLKPQRVEALGKYFPEKMDATDKLSTYREKVSDHVPISLKIEMK